jgi:hypothetical protein
MDADRRANEGCFGSFNTGIPAVFRTTEMSEFERLKRQKETILKRQEVTEVEVLAHIVDRVVDAIKTLSTRVTLIQWEVERLSKKRRRNG